MDRWILFEWLSLFLINTTPLLIVWLWYRKLKFYGKRLSYSILDMWIATIGLSPLLALAAFSIQDRGVLPSLIFVPGFVWQLSGMLVGRMWDSFPVDVPDSRWICGLRMLAFGYIALVMMIFAGFMILLVLAIIIGV